MDNNLLFSIIIPVYNAEKYLKKCLKSVSDQSYKNYEVIAVNDGSTDSSLSVLEAFSKKNPKIHVISQKNQGVSAARKTAVNAASGDYIAFLDSDDWFEPDFLKTVCDEIAENKSEIVQFGHNIIRFGLSKPVVPNRNTVNISEKCIKNFINGDGEINYSLWNKVYRQDIIMAAIQKSNDKLKFGEDGFLNLVVLSDNTDRKISVIDKCLYNYRQGSGVTSSNDKIKVYLETMKFKLAMIDYVQDRFSDPSIVRSICIDVSVITKYYSYIITEKMKTAEKKEKFYSDTVFRNPAVKRVRQFFIENGTEVPEAKTLTFSDVRQYRSYIDNYSEEYKNGLTTVQKLQKIFKI